MAISPATQNKDGFSLLQKGIFFFTVTVLFTLLLAVVVYFELTGGSITAQTTTDTTGLSGLVQSGNSLRSSLLLIGSFSGLFIMLIFGLIFFIRDITLPLAKIDKATRRMNAGQLDQPIQIKTRDEIGLTGELINDLAINTQEVLLLFWNHTQQNEELIERLEKKFHNNPGREGEMATVEEIFTQLKLGNNNVKSIILSYDFFNLKLEEEKMLSNHQPE